MNIRRVVTGHDQNGRAVVTIDEISKNVDFAAAAARQLRDLVDRRIPDRQRRRRRRRQPQGRRPPIRTAPSSAWSNIGPGVAPRNHRTESIDYAIVMSGEIDMDLDGTIVHLKAGDVLVQRGTIHNWINNGTEPCVVAFVLVAAKPVERGGKLLTATISVIRPRLISFSIRFI